MKKQKRKYSESFKIKVINSVLEGKCTKEEARRIYGIKSNCAILYWIREFNGIKNYRQPSEFEVSKNNQKEITLQVQRNRIAELEAELSQEKHRSALWKKMVEIAEEDLGIAIRKKFGAKQLLELKKKAEKR
ncbi:MAG: transposase [Ignavibacteriae bacterium]|jgi:transposase-like protein|nr:transposase [Ignavibacteriota bacterium]